MIIDMHNHADWIGHNMDRYLRNMDMYGIDKTVLLTWESPEDEYSPHYYAKVNVEHERDGGPVSFNRTLSYIERRPDRFIMGFAPDPRRPDAIDRLNSAIDLYGVRICGELKLRMMLDNFDAIRMYRFCGEKGLAVTVHIDYEFDAPNGNRYPRPNYWYGGGIEALERALIACPETTFLGHAPGFWAHISGDGKYKTEAYPMGPIVPGGKLPMMMEKYPNLMCDLSAGSGCRALSRDLDFTRQFLTEYQDRVVYARDDFDNQHQELLGSLGLPGEVLDKIYYKNALRVLHLDGEA